MRSKLGRVCRVCGSDDWYHYDNGRSSCAICDRRRQKKRVGKDRWARNIKTKFGLTPQEYNTLLDLQGGGCAICGLKPGEQKRRLNVDHDHETGEVRGILCSRCNSGLGVFGDNEEGLLKALEYLRG